MRVIVERPPFSSEDRPLREALVLPDWLFVASAFWPLPEALLPELRRDELRPLELRPLELRPLELRPLEVPPLELLPLELPELELRLDVLRLAAALRPPELRPLVLPPLELLRPLELRPLELRPLVLRPLELRPLELCRAVLCPLDSLSDPLPDAFALWLRVLPRVWRSPLLDDCPDAPRLLERLEEPRPRVADICTSCCSSPTSSERHELREQGLRRAYPKFSTVPTSLDKCSTQELRRSQRMIDPTATKDGYLQLSNGKPRRIDGPRRRRRRG
jgi:hypothetical protein